MMNAKGMTVILLSSIAIAGLLVWTFTSAVSVPRTLAQVSNATGSATMLTNNTGMAGMNTLSPEIARSATNNTGMAGMNTLSPEIAMKSVLEQARSTNATSYAIGNIINQTGLNSSASMPSENTTMRSILEQTRNTNATSFAAGNIINQTGINNNTNTN